jgi:hypothetical protein
MIIWLLAALFGWRRPRTARKFYRFQPKFLRQINLELWVPGDGGEKFRYCRGLSSAGLAANAITDTVCSLTNHLPGNDRHSGAVCSDGSYDVEQD